MLSSIPLRALQPPPTAESIFKMERLVEGPRGRVSFAVVVEGEKDGVVHEEVDPSSDSSHSPRAGNWVAIGRALAKRFR